MTFLKTAWMPKEGYGWEQPAVSGELLLCCLGQELARGSEPVWAVRRAVRGHRKLGRAKACQSPAKRRPCAVPQFSDLLFSLLHSLLPQDQGCQAAGCVCLGARGGLGAPSRPSPETRGGLRAHLHAVAILIARHEHFPYCAGNADDQVDGQAAGKAPAAFVGSITKSSRK